MAADAAWRMARDRLVGATLWLNTDGARMLPRQRILATRSNAGDVVMERCLPATCHFLEDR